MIKDTMLQRIILLGFIAKPFNFQNFYACDCVSYIYLIHQTFRLPSCLSCDTQVHDKNLLKIGLAHNRFSYFISFFSKNLPTFQQACICNCTKSCHLQIHQFHKANQMGQDLLYLELEIFIYLFWNHGTHHCQLITPERVYKE